MASIPPSKEYLSSTPIEQHHDNRLGSCKRFITSPVKGFDVLSPIKKTFPLRRNLFDNYTITGNYDVSNKIGNKKNSNLVVIEANFKFTELSNIIDIKASDNFDDSGIGSDKSLTISEDKSIFEKLTYFPTDENCNVISSYGSLNDDTSFQFSKCAGLKFLPENKLQITLNDELFEILDNRIETETFTNEKQNSNSVTNLDLLNELNLRNCSAVLSLILSYLPDEDLRKASYVGKEWQNIVFSDKKANARRKAYINMKRDIITGSQKENRFHSKYNSERSHKTVFWSVINSPIEESQQPLSCNKSVGKFDSFIQEGRKLSNEENLVKCPKCFYPSTIQSRYKHICTRNLCQYIFCKKCMGPHLDNHLCSMPKLNVTESRVPIGSKQSKKNLRRL